MPGIPWVAHLLPLDSRLLPLLPLCSLGPEAGCCRDRIRAISIQSDQLNHAAKQAAMNPDGPSPGGADPAARRTSHFLNGVDVSRRFKLSVRRHKGMSLARVCGRFGRTSADGSQATSEGLWDRV